MADLALDLRWSWYHGADEVWRQLDPALWEFTQNAWVVLQTVSQDKLRDALADPKFRTKVDALLQSQTPGSQKRPGGFKKATRALPSPAWLTSAWSLC